MSVQGKYITENADTPIRKLLPANLMKGNVTLHKQLRRKRCICMHREVCACAAVNRNKECKIWNYYWIFYWILPLILLS